MQYENIVHGTFLRRENRFIASVLLEGVSETVHVKNTGRCRELLIPGASVILTESGNPNRKTRFDLVAVKKPGVGLVNIDSQAPNTAMAEFLRRKNAESLQSEYRYGKSRIDFYFEYQGKKILLEVKSCTLERDGICYFPDAPTVRGCKHLKELASAVKNGFTACLAYVIPIPGGTRVVPNEETDPFYAKCFCSAKANGVHILYCPCKVAEDGFEILSAEEDPD